jgi:hypothetical protein
MPNRPVLLAKHRMPSSCRFCRAAADAHDLRRIMCCIKCNQRYSALSQTCDLAVEQHEAL